ncbi:hypothetical protein PRIPAC_73364 [Pristionchus pacificus]|uniref:Uncharacterized protein n=1 Tax=Pristionchus pacificus TaxID=54126 RepID=A0A2A6CFH5_PRIPA|nr:hypothetical protein PRIPAC_73364 [Pristionchus pacificus]|eukprot:PDM76866.1 hypothetical protein PRIPAC_42261 [Pristionchus pacificus]
MPNWQIMGPVSLWNNILLLFVSTLFLCGHGVDRMCTNPISCYGSYCPKYTAGTDKEAAKLELTFGGGSSGGSSLVALYICCGIMALAAFVVGIICCMRRTRGADYRIMPNNLAADYPRQGAPSPGPVPCPVPNSNRAGSNSDVESQ